MPDRVKPPIEKLTAHQILTLVGLVALVAITLIFDVDVGLVAISVAVVLTLAAPGLQKRAIDEIKWPVVLLITGVLKGRRPRRLLPPAAGLRGGHRRRGATAGLAGVDRDRGLIRTLSLVLAKLEAT